MFLNFPFPYLITAEYQSNDHTSISINPSGPSKGTEKTKKGGSFLCHKSYCYRYRNSARHHTTPDSATQNSGFRCVK